MAKARSKASTADNSARVSPVSSNRKSREEALFSAYLEGSSIRAAAAQLGIPKSSAQVIIAKMTAANGGSLPPKPKAEPAPEPVIAEAPFIAKTVPGSHHEYPDLYPSGFEECARNIELAPVSSDVIRVLAIGDSHDHPGIKDKRRFAAIGRLAARERYDWLLHIGDSTDMNSLCHHVKNDTFRARHKPSFQQDIDSLAEALAAIEDEMPRSYKPRKHICLGNHETWAEHFEDKNPELQGTLVGPLLTVYESHDWSHTPFAQMATIGGVDFVHAPLGIMGRPAGGKNVESTIANDAIKDLVFGHTHRFNDIMRPKYGAKRGVRIVNCGSSMPPGYVGDYARFTPNFMSYGLTELVIQHGQIQQVQFRPLENLYRELGLGDVKKAA